MVKIFFSAFMWSWFFFRGVHRLRMPKATCQNKRWCFGIVANFQQVVWEPVFFADISIMKKLLTKRLWNSCGWLFNNRHSQVLSPMVVVISDFHSIKLLELQKWCPMLGEKGYTNTYLLEIPGNTNFYDFITRLSHLSKLCPTLDSYYAIFMWCTQCKKHAWKSTTISEEDWNSGYLRNAFLAGISTAAGKILKPSRLIWSSY